MDDYNPQIGIKLPNCKTPQMLCNTLTRIENAGFDFTEFHVDMFPLIIGGKICKPWVELVKNELERHNLSYSAHIGRALDLRNDNIDLHNKLFKASIDVASMLNASPLVIHYENKTRDSQKEKQFKKYLREGSLYAAEKNVLICLENIEVERVEPVVDIISSLNLDNLKMTLDTGHSYLASKYYHFDYFKAIESTIPYLGHIHLNDNTGVFEESRITDRVYYDTLEEGMRRELGMGDIHVPPFFAEVPFKDIFALLKDYRGKYLCEYNTSSFIPFERIIQEDVRASILESMKK